MELPGADAVGWYRYNAKPGEAGSSVLSAHISYNGTNGVFRYLSDVEARRRGHHRLRRRLDRRPSRSSRSPNTTSRNSPSTASSTRTDDPVLTLITCGGDFNSSLRSYEDNFVAYAVPIDA